MERHKVGGLFKPTDIRAEDAVLVEWRGNFLLYLVKEVRGELI